jgi:hypothetical protein
MPGARSVDLSSFMTLLDGSAIGLVMLCDLRRRGQSTSPPATAIIILPMPQLIIRDGMNVNESL